MRFNQHPSLIASLNETEMTQLLERPDGLAANPKLMAAFAPRLPEFYELYSQSKGGKGKSVGDITSRLLRRLAYVDDAILDEREMNSLVDDFFDEISTALAHDARASITKY